jgi:alpha-galactosidase/6-phospho-beta-glucosidase family protein
MTQITFVGGGSFQWMPKLLVDVALTPSLADAEIVLEDVDPAPLPRMVEVAEHIARLRGLSWRVRATTDQRDGLRGADYVVVCISTGALDSMAFDLEIPERFGVRQSVGDSVGPGGINRALRNIPVLVGIARDMVDVCPGATMLNLTNPMTTLTRAVRKATAVDAVGLCHEVTGTTFQLSLLLDCDMRAIEPDVCGVNHLPIITALRVDGIDRLPELRDRLDDPGSFGAEPFTLPPSIGHEAVSFGGEFTKQGILDQHRVKLELLRRFGALPAAGDRHVVEFFPGFLTEATDWGEQWGVHLTTIADRRKWLRWYGHELEKLLATETIDDTPSGEMVAPIIDSRARDRIRRLPLNIPNGGQCPDLPNDVVVESMCRVDASGVHGTDPVRAPRLLGEYLRRVAASQELTVDAALDGDRDLAFEAMLADPLASRVDYDSLWRMTNELIDATSRWLPQF